MGEKNQQQVMVVLKCIMLHPCLDVMTVKYFQYIPRGVCNINQSRKALQRHHIFLTDSNCDYIIEDVLHR